MTFGRSRYGDREAYSKASQFLITRPDDTMFVQNDLNTYRRTTVPTVQPPETRSNRLEGMGRAPSKGGTMINTMDQATRDSASDVVHRFEVSRKLSETGRSWLITLALPGGRETVVSRLRSHREGNGF